MGDHGQDGLFIVLGLPLEQFLYLLIKSLGPAWIKLAGDYGLSVHFPSMVKLSNQLSELIYERIFFYANKDLDTSTPVEYWQSQPSFAGFNGVKGLLAERA
jgi:hypothetical protein